MGQPYRLHGWKCLVKSILGGGRAGAQARSLTLQARLHVLSLAVHLEDGKEHTHTCSYHCLLAACALGHSDGWPGEEVIWVSAPGDRGDIGRLQLDAFIGFSTL